MAKMRINDCYVLGTSLLYLEKLSVDRIEKIRKNLDASGIIAELTDASIKSTVEEWRDFFCFDSVGNIVLTPGATSNKYLMGLIFYDALGDDVKQKVLSSVLNYPRPQVIDFQSRVRR